MGKFLIFRYRVAIISFVTDNININKFPTGDE